MANVYGELVFDLSERTVNDSYIVDNIQNLTFTDISSCAITVTADQTEGTYKLAGNAGEFNRTISIGTNTASFGTLTVGGTALTYNGKSYTLALNDSNLVLTIGNTVTPPVAGDQVQVYSSGTLVKQGKVLTGETIVSGANNSMFVYDGGTANETVINSSGRMYISSGGVANKTYLQEAYASMTIYSGGKANDTEIRKNGFINVSNGGFASNTTICGENNPSNTVAGGMFVYVGGSVEKTTLNDCGHLFVYSGAAAAETVVNSGGWLLLWDKTAQGVYGGGGTASNTVVNKDGYMRVCSGAFASNTTLWGDMTVSVGSAADTKVNNNGIMNVYSNGLVEDTEVNNKGKMYVYRGGSANNVDIHDNGYASFQGFELLEEHKALHASGKDVKVSSGGSVYISGGEITNLLVSSGGNAYVCGLRDVSYVDVNGRICNGEIKSGGELTIGDGTELMGDIIFGGTIIVNGSADVIGEITFDLSERTVNDSYIVDNIANLYFDDFSSCSISVTANQANGTYKLAQGAASFTGTLTIGDGTINYGSLTVNGDDFVYNGVTYSLDQLDGNLTLTIGGGATPPVAGDQVRVFKNDILIKQGKILIGEQIEETGNDKMIVYKDGIASNTVVSSGGAVFVSSGGLLKDTTVWGNLIDKIVPLYVPGINVPQKTNLAVLNVYGGGYAENLDIYKNGRANFIGKEMPEDYDALYASGKNVNVSSGGSVYISGGEITNLLVSSGGNAYVCGLRDVSYVDVNGRICNGEIKSGGELTIGDGTELMGDIIFGGTIIVNGTADVIGEVTFDLSERDTADRFIVNNLAYLNMSMSSFYTISVTADQANGTYKLAQGAEGFTGTLSIGDGTVNYGSLTVNGADLSYNGVTYSLDQLDGNLTLTITGAAAPPVTNGLVQVFKGENLVKQGNILTGETIIGTGNDKMIVYKNGIAKDTQVNNDGNMLVSEGGLASNTTLRGAEYIYVKDEDPRYGVYSPHPGTMNVFAGGIASNTTIYEGGKLYASGGIANDVMVHSYGFVCVTDGGVVNNITTDEDWCWIKARNGGTINNIINYGGSIGIDKDGTLNNAVLNGSPDITNTGVYVYAGGIAKNTIANSGHVTAYEGGTIDTVKVNTAAFMLLEEGAIICGKHIYAGKVNADGNIDAANADVIFDISERKEADNYIINNISYFNAKSYSITVSANQANGTYKLAQGAASFTGTLTIGDGSVDYGSITVNGADFSYNGATYSLDQLNGNLTLTITNKPAIAENDLDGNGLADVVLVHTKQGYSGAWLTTGDASIIKWGNLSYLTSDIEILGTGKLHGTENDGQDIFFTDGKSVGAWNVVEGKVTGYKNIMNVNATTNVLGLGDFNGDGATDILLRSTNGDLGYFGTDGTGWKYIKGLGKEWKIVAVGDLDGDGCDDVIVRHDAGFTGAYMIDENGKITWSNLDTLKSDMAIVGTGDFNGDGVDDVLLQNKSNGWVGAWLVENGRVDSFIGLCNNKNTIEQIADFNGDGIDDLRIRTEKGDIGVLYVNGEDNTTWQYFQSVGKEWDTSFALLS